MKWVKKRKRQILFLLIIVLFLAANSASDARIIFDSLPKSSARWEVAGESFALGERIPVTLTIVTQPGTRLDISRLPDVGDSFQLPSKVVEKLSDSGGYSPDSYYEKPEGSLEVLTREIERYMENGLVITRIVYEFQYLQEISPEEESGVDDKALPWDIPVKQEYLRQSPNGKILKTGTAVPAAEDVFYIVPRVDGRSKPILTLVNLPAPANPWPRVRMVGYSLIGLAVLLFLLRLASAIRLAHREKQAILPTPPPKIEALVSAWREEMRIEVFEDILIRYRHGVWGKPSPANWMRSTIILYSRITINQATQEKILGELVAEVEDAST